MSYLITVVIPAFNVEDYIQFTIESVIRQKEFSMENIQVIIVDDGSTDSTRAIVSNYLENKNIKLLSQNNKGVSAARNVGIKNSEGKYILFLDGDDLLASNFFSNFFKVNFKADLLVGNRYHLSQKRILVSNYFDNIFKVEDFLEYSIKNKIIFWNMGGYLIRKEIIDKNEIFFCEELASAEDLNFFLKVLKSISKVYTTDIEFFDYRLDREDSAMKIRTKEKIINQLTVYHEGYMEYKSNLIIAGFFSDFYLNILSQTGYINSKIEKLGIIEYSKKIDIPKGNTKNYRVYSLLYKYLGINLASYIIVLIRNIRTRW